jgi:hypothetical protein
MGILEFLEQNLNVNAFYEDMGIFYLLNNTVNPTIVACLKSALTTEFDKEYLISLTAMAWDNDGTFVINFEFTPRGPIEENV